MCIFCETLRANIKHRYEMDLARIKHEYETKGTPMNYEQWYPGMVESLERRVNDRMQEIADELARGAYTNQSSGGFGGNSCC